MFFIDESTVFVCFFFVEIVKDDSFFEKRLLHKIRIICSVYWRSERKKKRASKSSIKLDWRGLDCWSWWLQRQKKLMCQEAR